MTENASTGKPGRSTAVQKRQDDRKVRAAAALRENLKRRKAQVKARKSDASATDTARHNPDISINDKDC